MCAWNKHDLNNCYKIHPSPPKKKLKGGGDYRYQYSVSFLKETNGLHIYTALYSISFMGLIKEVRDTFILWC